MGDYERNALANLIRNSLEDRGNAILWRDAQHAADKVLSSTWLAEWFSARVI